MKLYYTYLLIILASFSFSNDQLIDELYLDMTQNSTPTSISLEAGEEYYLIVSGTYCVGSCWPSDGDLQSWNGNNRDAAFAYATYENLPSPGGHWEWNETLNVRPFPDEYNSDHTYYYPFTSDGGPEVFHFQDDGGYGDSFTGLTIKIYEM